MHLSLCAQVDAAVSPADSRVFTDKMLFPHLKVCAVVNCWQVGHALKERNCPSVAENVIAPFFLPGTAAPLTFPTLLLLKAIFKQNPQTFLHFVAK